MNYKCVMCNSEFKAVSALSSHITKMHKYISKENYTINYFYNNIPPTCKCGCGYLTRFKYLGSFSNYKSGHNENNSFKKNSSHTIESKLKISNKLKGRVSPNKKNKISKSCLNCNNGILVIPSKVETTKFCNKNCYTEYMLKTDNPQYNRFKLDNPMHDISIMIKNHKKTQNGGLYKLKERVISNNIITYQSQLENDFIDYCVDSNIEINNGDSIDYWFNDKLCKYHIDFKVKINNKFHLVELKSPHKWYWGDLESGKLQAKENFVKIYNNSVMYGNFIFILDNNNVTRNELFAKHLIIY